MALYLVITTTELTSRMTNFSLKTAREFLLHEGYKVSMETLGEIYTIAVGIGIYYLVSIGI